MNRPSMCSASIGFKAAIQILVAAGCTNVAAQVQSPPPIQDHYASATLLVAPVATPVTPPPAVTSEADYLSVYGQQPAGVADPGRMAARLFFAHGGAQLYVASPATQDADGFRDALADTCGLDVDLVIAAGLECCTGAAADDADLMNDLATHAAATQQRFALLHPPQGSEPASLLAFRASLANTPAAAMHAPWLLVPDPVTPGTSTTVPASAAVAGIVSRIDLSEGIHVSPAGIRAEILADTLESDLSADADTLNVEGVNVIRAFSDPEGILVWGARTLAASPEFRFIAPTRLYRHLKHSVIESLQWVREEDSVAVQTTDIENRLETYLFGYWQAGSFQGTTADEAYFHACTADVVSLRCTVGISAIRPAEFSVFVVDIPFREVLFRSDFVDPNCG